MPGPIDLRSDTVTRPSKAMLQAMMNAEVGDDVFGDDPTVIALEKRCATMFGMEKAVFCPSGTMTNQIAIKVHTQPGDELICEQSTHVYRYEGGGIAFNSGVSVRTVMGDRGRLKPEDVIHNINPDNAHFPKTQLVTIENTSNRGGGSCYTPSAINEISETCRKNNLKIHLDGARIFNALIVTGGATSELGRQFDSISVCFSKGLGAPAGSVLMGDEKFIYKARRIRKVLGGGMRQAGIFAGACLYALNHNIERLKEDHRRAKILEMCILKLPYIEQVLPVETNILIFQLKKPVATEIFVQYLEQNSLKAVSTGPQQIRMVTHLDFEDEQLERAVKILEGFPIR